MSPDAHGAGLAMELSPAGLELIKRSEGFRESVYTDVAGFPTIGYGHRLQPGESFPNGVTELEAQAILTADAGDAEQAVSRLVKVTLTQGQYDALVDFTFMRGSGRLAGSTMLKELNEGHYAVASELLLAWDHAGGVVNSGLKARRIAEYNLWMGEAA